MSRSCSCQRFKQRFEFIVPDSNDFYAILDAAKVADCLLLVVPIDDDVDEFGEMCLTSLFAQGIVSTVLCCQVKRNCFYSCLYIIFSFSIGYGTKYSQN